MNENYRIGKDNLHIVFPSKEILNAYVMCAGCSNCNYHVEKNILCLFAYKKENLLHAVLNFKIYTWFLLNVLKSISNTNVVPIQELCRILDNVEIELERSL